MRFQLLGLLALNPKGWFGRPMLLGRWVPVKNPRDAKKESGGKNGDAAGPEGSDSVVIGAGGPHRV